MTAPHNEKAPPTGARSIRFADEEWQAITAAAERLTEELHIEVSPSEFVRMAARKQLEQAA